jgi:hypothetical protein
MTAAEIAHHNEAIAKQKIRIAYIQSGIIESMRLCALYMGLSASDAYIKAREICKDLIGEGQE